MKNLETVKKEIEGLKTKLDAVKPPSGLCWEAKRLLQLYAQGYHDWCAPEHRKPWRRGYQEALKNFGAELAHPETTSRETLYWLSFMTWFRGHPDEKKQWDSLLEFYLLARTIAPKTAEELIMHKGLEHLYSAEQLKASREFLTHLDEIY